MTDPATLAASANASVCAPAGYGKTELIGRALLAGPVDRHLVLTHTHAGVHALRERFEKLGVERDRYRIDTIAGWALQYARSFPKTTGYAPPQEALKEDWVAVYEGVTTLLRTSPARNTIQYTYVGAYIDEYQDCTKPQHELIMSIAALVPCRVLGDPLQAIFNFAEPTVDWTTDVTTAFPPLPSLTTPHRWRHDPAFAAWIQHVRAALDNAQPISLANGCPNAVITRHPRSPQERTQLLQQAVNRTRNDGRTVVVTQWATQCPRVAQQTRGPLVIEPIDSDDFATAATTIMDNLGIGRVAAILAFAAKCYTGFDQQTTQRLAGAAQGAIRPRTTTHNDQINALKAVLATDDIAPIPEALTALSHTPETRITRPELYFEIRRTFKNFLDGTHTTILDALAHTRQITRQHGRRLTQQTVGHTLLIKGLEFDHAIVLDPEALNAQNLYVALTRGKKSLTIITTATTLQPNI